MAVSRSQIWQRRVDSIPASSAKIVDTIPLEDFRGLEYMLSVKNDAGDKHKSLKLNVKNDDSSLSHSISGRLGVLGIEVNPQINGSSYELQINNVETSNLTITMARAIY